MQKIDRYIENRQYIQKIDKRSIENRQMDRKQTDNQKTKTIKIGI